MPVVTVHQVYKTLRNTIAYIVNPKKTVGGQAVSLSKDLGFWDPSADQNRQIRFTESEMMHDLYSRGNPQGRASHGRKILAQHVIQSFDPNDTNLTWQEVHEMGVQLAEKITQGKYKYVVATHTNRRHLHNHIIICQASNTSPHRKMRTVRTTLESWRRLSDTIALEHGVPTLPDPVGPTGRRISEVYAAMRKGGQLQRLRSLISEAAVRSDTFASFQHFLASHGVTVRPRGRDLTYTDHTTNLKVRGIHLGAWYGMEGVATRIAEEGELSCITLNKKLVVSTTPDEITVWLPDSRRRTMAVLPRRTATYDGKTWTVWLSQDDRATLENRDREYAGLATREQLLTHFGKASVRWFEPYRDNRMKKYEEVNRLIAKSAAQQRYLDWIDRENLRLQDMIDATNAIRKWGGWPGGSLTPTVIAKAEANALAEQNRLHKAHSRLLGSASIIADGKNVDQKLEDLERRAALIGHDIHLMKGELQHVLETDRPAPAPQIPLDRSPTSIHSKADWLKHPTGRQETFTQVFHRKGETSGKAARRAENRTIGKANTLLDRTGRRLKRHDRRESERRPGRSQ